MFILTVGHRGNTLKKKHRHHHRDVHRHASLGSAVPAFCLNYTLVCLYAEPPWRPPQPELQQPKLIGFIQMNWKTWFFTTPTDLM